MPIACMCCIRTFMLYYKLYRLYQILCISVSRVTSQFILDGCLDALGMLSKLNLSRTTVCDSGMTRLQLLSLTMLNVNWTCVTEKTSLDTLRGGGCVECGIMFTVDQGRSQGRC